MLVVALAILAGSPAIVAASLGAAMLGFQVSIGAFNDVLDADRDRLTKPDKPIPAGAIDRVSATLIGTAGGAVGLGISAAFGLPVLVLGAAGYACGLAYDLGASHRGWGWICFAAAFPLLLAWTWVAAAGSLPPAWPLLLPLAALAGPSIHLANSLVDIDADERAGARSLATALGRDRSRTALAILTFTVYGLAWAILFLTQDPPLAALVVAGAATLLAGLGVGLSWRPAPRARAWGWLLQASGLALLAVAWASAYRAYPDGLDYLVTGVGTGGHITGCAEILDLSWPGLKVYAVEPTLSAVLSGGTHTPHHIQGIGAGFVPDVMRPELLDGILQVAPEDAMAYARRSAREEGVLVGISSVPRSRRWRSCVPGWRMGRASSPSTTTCCSR